MIVTTTDGLQGHTIVEYKGLVSGTAIHGVNVGKDFKALGRNLVGGRAGAYEDEIDRGQSEAMAEMQQAAEGLGANAVVGASIDVEGVGTNTSMLLVTVSGTAVVIEEA
jgi:uncharacterized protein YbjQ (UPF0145 family)